MKAPEGGLVADINVTPMIDVLLVLLVIFMLMPQKRALFPVNVPPDRAPSGTQSPQIVLELGTDRSYAINGVKTAKEELGQHLAQIYAGRPQKVLFIRTGRGWRYGDVIEAVDIARGAGVQVIGYVPLPTRLRESTP
jgi:biopolymer transport protein ExbD